MARKVATSGCKARGTLDQSLKKGDGGRGVHCFNNIGRINIVFLECCKAPLLLLMWCEKYL